MTLTIRFGGGGWEVSFISILKLNSPGYKYFVKRRYSTTHDSHMTHDWQVRKGKLKEKGKKKKKRKKSTAPSIPTRSPIEVLTRLDVA